MNFKKIFTSVPTKFYLAIILILLLILLFISANPKEYTIRVDNALDTVSSITVYGSKAKKTALECSETVYKYDKLLSVSNSESEIYKINHSSDKTTVSPEVFNLISSCESFYNDTDGRFDITIGALSQIWNDAIASRTLPSEESIKNSVPLTGYSSLILNDSDFSITKSTENTEISLGACAKGYIADKIFEHLKTTHADGALIDLGGNVCAYGSKPDGSAWRIGIQNPAELSSLIGTVTVDDGFVITSGDYQRYAIINGVRYHHIIDTKTGYPAKSGLRSVTIITDNGFIGDSLSTACFLAGLDKGIELLEKYNASGIFVTDDCQVYYSKKLNFSPSDTNYSYFEY